MYYSGEKILSLKDINGKQPELYFICGDRSAGKTVFFNRYFIRRFLKNNEKFILLYRYKYELDNVANKFFAEIKNLFFPNLEMIDKKKAGGLYSELYLNKKLCGYAIPINSADKLKTYSHLFADCTRLLFDEFQSENGKYCQDEVTKFISIHTSLSRGAGKQVKYLPCFLISNRVSLLNPYFAEIGISEKITKNTKFLRGDGYIVEMNRNESVRTLQKESAFNRAFANNKYIEYSSGDKELNDNDNFIEKMKGKNNYICTIAYNNERYSLTEYENAGIIYCGDTFDNTFPRVYSLTTDDHNINYVMLAKNSEFVRIMRDLYEKGCFRFKNLKCKNVVIEMLKYR